MARIIIGLEITDRAWNAVALESSKDRVSILGHAVFSGPPFTLEQLCDPGLEDPVVREKFQEWAGRISEFMGSFGEGTPLVVAGIPQELTSRRILEIPFSQPSRIEKVLPFEAEASLPFDSEDQVFDYYSLARTDGHTRVFSVSIDRDAVAGLIAHLGGMGIDPVVLTPSGLALDRLFSMAGPEAGGRVGFLRVDSHHSSLSVVEAGRTVFTTGLAAGLYPRSESSGGEEEGGREERRMDASELCEKLSAELVRVFHFLEGFFPLNGSLEHPGAGGCPPRLRKLVLLGKGADRELAAALSRALDVKVEEFTIPPQYYGNGGPEPPSAQAGPPLALALSMTAPPEAAINFRKGEFAFHPERRELYRKLVFPAVLCVLLLVTMAVRFSVGGSSEAREVEAIRTEMETAFKQAFPGEPVVDPARQISQILDETTEKFQRYRQLTGPTALKAVAAVSAAIPPSIEVTITSFDYNGERLSISGVTDNLDSPNEIAKKLGQVPFFEKVELGNARQMKDFEFRFDISATFRKGAAQ